MACHGCSDFPKMAVFPLRDQNVAAMAAMASFFHFDTQLLFRVCLFVVAKASTKYYSLSDQCISFNIAFEYRLSAVPRISRSDWCRREK
jgi:hypothetical protein